MRMPPPPKVDGTVMGRIRRYGLVAGGVSLEIDLRFQRTMPFLVSFLPPVYG